MKCVSSMDFQLNSLSPHDTTVLAILQVVAQLTRAATCCYRSNHSIAVHDLHALPTTPKALTSSRPFQSHIARPAAGSTAAPKQAHVGKATLANKADDDYMVLSCPPLIELPGDAVSAAACCLPAEGFVCNSDANLSADAVLPKCMRQLQRQAGALNQGAQPRPGRLRRDHSKHPRARRHWCRGAWGRTLAGS